MYPDLVDTFLDLVETQSFNRTADRLEITQSTVSARIRTLERHLDCRLFTRSRSGTELTRQGIAFEPHARVLRQSWQEALRATGSGGSGQETLRIGIQHDLVGSDIGDWIRRFQEVLPDTNFYVEPDYSVQMCTDLERGGLDFAVLFSPRTHPDLHLESLGEITYDMVSTVAETLDEVETETYFVANYSPAFSHQHEMLLPRLATSRLTIGQDAAISGLIRTLGGTAYVLTETAQDLVTAGTAHLVTGAPKIPQSVYVVQPIRQRHRPSHLRLVRMLREQFQLK